MAQPPFDTHPTSRLAISDDGIPVLSKRYTIPARCGIAVRLAPGESLTVINPSGRQVCDFWAFAGEYAHEYLSMAHIHTDLSTLFPKVGQRLVSNRRRALLTLVEDTSPGVHDTVIACCDQARYEQLGCDGYHDNCADNLTMALAAIGIEVPLIPAPFNLWMNIPIAADGATHFAAPVAAPEDRMTFRAEAAVVAVMSACPQDMTPVNGTEGPPGPLAFEVAA